MYNYTDIAGFTQKLYRAWYCNCTRLSARVETLQEKVKTAQSRVQGCVLHERSSVAIKRNMSYRAKKNVSLKNFLSNFLHSRNPVGS